MALVGGSKLFTDRSGASSFGIPKPFRVAGSGAASFELQDDNDDGTRHMRKDNLTLVASGVPGRQTVPRSELWGAIAILTRAHANVCARISIDAFESQIAARLGGATTYALYWRGREAGNNH